MKQGRTLTELAAELDRQAGEKRDFVAPTNAMSVRSYTPERTVVELDDTGTFPLNETAHGQFADRLGIPRKYYQKMREESPELLDTNLNTWLKKSSASRFMLRTLDGNARALLSDRYRPLDNYDLLQVALPALQSANCKIESCQVTETKLYLKAVSPKLEYKVVGDVVQAGIVISNSEVGAGSVSVEPLLFKLGCLNGMIINDAQMRRAHIGRGNEGFDNVKEFFKDATRLADDKAFWLKVKDVIGAAFESIVFEKHVERFNAAAHDKIASEPVKVVEVTQKRFSFSEGERNGILQHLFREGDLTRFGLANAVTRAAQDVESYDRSTELERIGGLIIELPKRDWEVINKEAA